MAPRDSDKAQDAATPASGLRLQGENGAEFWIAYDNFYVITRYNRSLMYAMAVTQLGNAIKEARQAAGALSQEKASNI